MKNVNRRKSERGVVLFFMAMSALALCGALALSVDVGRMYIAKNEAQAFADSSAVWGALKLDGTSTGIVAANDVLASNPNRWNMMTNPFTGAGASATTKMEFASAAAGPWDDYATASGAPTNTYRYVRVTATPSVALFIIPVLVNQFSATTPAVSVGGQAAQSGFNQGLFPFSPVTILPNASPDFGLTATQTYALRMANNANNDTCTGESAAYKTALYNRPNQYDGYWSTSHSNSVVSATIRDDLQTGSLSIGDPIPLIGGSRQAEFAANGALLDRVAQDTDSSSLTYAAYRAAGLGNNRRVVGMPISCSGSCTFTDPVTNITYSGSDLVAGFGAFFLTEGYPSQGNQTYCAEYIGPWTGMDTKTPGAGGSGSGAAKVLLVQ
jgi:Flp pilus assembly protein TadG